MPCPCTVVMPGARGHRRRGMLLLIRMCVFAHYLNHTSFMQNLMVSLDSYVLMYCPGLTINKEDKVSRRWRYRRSVVTNHYFLPAKGIMYELQ
jgi:hypothetical protein